MRTRTETEPKTETSAAAVTAEPVEHTDGPPYLTHPLDQQVRARATEDAHRFLRAARTEPGMVDPWPSVSAEDLDTIVDLVARSVWGTLRVAMAEWETAQSTETAQSAEAAQGAATAGTADAPAAPAAKQRKVGGGRTGMRSAPRPGGRAGKTAASRSNVGQRGRNGRSKAA